MAPPTDPWNRRLERAVELEARWPYARDVLRFFRALTSFQQDVALRLPRPVPPDAGSLANLIPALLDLAVRQAPRGLAESARQRRAGSLRGWENALRSFWRGHEGDTVDQFFLEVVLQPYALLARESWIDSKSASDAAGSGNVCPFCAHAPALGILREDPLPRAATRLLLCSLCSCEWAFPRVLCPSCGEEQPEKLQSYAAMEASWVRAEACGACKRYLKTIDLTQEPRAEPVVDELASIPLDVIAREKGYVKIRRNLAGM